MIIILFGSPGAGKGSQSSLLEQKLDFKKLSTGDLLRYHIENKTKLGVEADLYMSRGQLVPCDTVIKIVREEINLYRNHDLILDGFPRTIKQAEDLDCFLKEKKIDIAKVISLEVPYSSIEKRLLSRKVCHLCGESYNDNYLLSNCSKCGTTLAKRHDDDISTVKNRIRIFEEMTLPLKDYYDRQRKLVRIDGDRDILAVYEEIEKILN